MVSHYGEKLPSPRRTEYADAWVAVSSYAITAFPETVRDKVVVIENGVDPARIAPKRTRAEVRDSWGVPRSAKVLGCLQRMSKEKNSGALAIGVAHLPMEWFGVRIGMGHDAGEI